MKTKTLLVKSIQVLSVLFLAIVLYVNYLSMTLPINGVTIKELSDKYQTLFTPASITFSIWAVLYLGLVLYVFWQLKSLFSSAFMPEVDVVIRKIGVLFLLSCVFNSAWIFAWHYNKMFFSVIIMIGLLLTLIEINQRVRYELPNTPQYKLFLRLPFGMYLGWVSIALITNIAAYLTKTGWNGFGLDPRFWQMTMIAVATIISCWAVVKLNNVGYGLVVIWALGGILLVRINDAIPSLAITLLITLCVFIVLFTTVNRIKSWAT